MNIIRVAFGAIFILITVIFALCALGLIGFALVELWRAFDPAQQISVTDRFNAILESIGLLTIAVAALELSQTILEEEVRREAHLAAPTRVRRFLSRFMVVIVVSLSIEFLVIVFELVHSDPAQLFAVSAVGIATAALLAGWGVFVWLNRKVEELEPEAMEDAKREDAKVQESR